MLKQHPLKRHTYEASTSLIAATTLLAALGLVYLHLSFTLPSATSVGVVRLPLRMLSAFPLGVAMGYSAAAKDLVTWSFAAPQVKREILLFRAFLSAASFALLTAVLWASNSLHLVGATARDLLLWGCITWLAAQFGPRRTAWLLPTCILTVLAFAGQDAEHRPYPWAVFFQEWNTTPSLIACALAIALVSLVLTFRLGHLSRVGEASAD